MGNALTSIELFAGGGGLLLGCSLAGFTHELAVEWDGPSCATLRRNEACGYPLIAGTKIHEGDVRDVSWNNYVGQLDLLAGGPPCQPFSLGGLARAALDPRDMFPAMTHVLSVLRPRAFVIENVKGLTRSSFADYYSYILLRLQHPTLTAREDESWRDHLARLSREHTSGVHDDLRYEVVPTVVDAADYGVPQHRMRVIIVGFREDVNADWSFPAKTHSGAALFEAKQSGDYWERHAVPMRGRSLGSRHSGDAGLLPWRTVRDALAGLPEPKIGGVPGWFIMSCGRVLAHTQVIRGRCSMNRRRRLRPACMVSQVERTCYAIRMAGCATTACGRLRAFSVSPTGMSSMPIGANLCGKSGMRCRCVLLK